MSQQQPQLPPESDSVALRNTLANRQIIVASNREPYRHEKDGDGISVSRPVGGLTAALDPMMQSIGDTWVAWGDGSADRTVVNDDDLVSVPPASPAYQLRRVWLDEGLVNGHYYGYSNQVLWPLCHGLPSKIKYDRTFWRAYHQVNERFADAIVEEAEEDPMIWLHDYHLGLTPKLVRNRRSDSVDLVHFWHIPWPPWDILRRGPHHEELVASLLSNDVLAFHTELDRQHFVRCAQRTHDVEYIERSGTVAHGDLQTATRTAPLTVDVDQLEQRVRSDDAETFWSRLSDDHQLDSVSVAVGVDRLDYTKGLLKRLDALETLFETRSTLRGELTYLQKASTSRTKIDAYQTIIDQVHHRVKSINGRFGTADWQPIVYLEEMLTPEELAGLYRHADIGVVTPCRDGLNLVAKEYLAAQIDNDGILILSPMAGAAEQLSEGALLVNPHNLNSLAETFAEAVELPVNERQRRCSALRQSIKQEDLYQWLDRQFRPLSIKQKGRPV